MTTMKQQIISLLLVSIMLAGCTESIPSPSEIFSDDEPTNEWITETGEFTLEMSNNTNQTLIYAPTIWLDVNTSYGALEIGGLNYTVTHLSFTVINNTVIFNNYSFDMRGYIVQDTADGKVYWQEGLAPEFGNATLHFAAFPFDVTVTYEVTYRIWDGRI